MKQVVMPRRVQRSSLSTRAPHRVSVRTIVSRSSARQGVPISNQLDFEEQFQTLGTSTAIAGQIIQPPYSVSALYRLREESNMLAQCIEAYVTNIVLPGWEVEPLYRGATSAPDEEFELQSFVDNPNVDQSLVMLLADVIRDRETTGFAFLEVVRDASNTPSILRHASSVNTRMMRKHPNPVQITTTIMRGRRVTTVAEQKKFRRFVQLDGALCRYFKEFGDPRKMDYMTGAFEGEPGYIDRGADASEIYMFRINNHTSPYGAPRWINQAPSVVGSREAEEVNVRYFKDNTVPAMMLLVGNGRLTAQSYAYLEKQLNEQEIGKDRQNKILLVEAMGESESLDGKASPITLNLQRLSDARQSDELFGSYIRANQGRVRSSFRLPPVLVGMSEDVNFATASTSVLVAEAQVFAPERELLDQMLNRAMVNGAAGLGLRTVRLVARTPSITSPDQVIKTLTALNVMGALTPRYAQQVVNKLLQTELPPYPQPNEEGYEEWMDRPMQLSLRNTPENTHDEQSQKTEEIKGTEGTGDTEPTRPRNGAQ